MGKWIDKLQNRGKSFQIPTHVQLTKLTKAPSVGSVSVLPKGIQKNKPVSLGTDKDVIHIQGGILDTEIWVVPDNFIDTPQSNVYTDSEVRELTRLQTTSEALKAVHMVREVFGGVIVDSNAYPTSPEILQDTGVGH